MSELLEPPRWPGGPPICEKENRPAFATADKAKVFNAGHPAIRMTRLWKCDFCDHWHYTFKMRAPSGDSSGSSRR